MDATGLGRFLWKATNWENYKIMENCKFIQSQTFDSKWNKLRLHKVKPKSRVFFTIKIMA